VKRIIVRLGIFILVLTILACGVFFIFRSQLVEYFVPDVEQIGDINIKVINDTSYISSRLVIKNKSFLEIGIDTLKYKISLLDKIYLQNEQFIGAVLPDHGNDTLNLSLQIPYVTILKDLKAERKISDSADYAINVSIQFSTPFGKAEIPINKSAKLKIPQPPELEIEEITWQRIRWKSIYANAKIKIVNYGPVTLSIKDMTYTMKILNQGDLKGSSGETINIKPKETTYIELPIKINVDNLGKTVYDIMRNQDSYSYTLVLNAILESTEPINESFKVNITKTGRVELKK